MLWAETRWKATDALGEARDLGDLLFGEAERARADDALRLLGAARRGAAAANVPISERAYQLRVGPRAP